jgi:hypothetical protein
VQKDALSTLFMSWIVPALPANPQGKDTETQITETEGAGRIRKSDYVSGAFGRRMILLAVLVKRFTGMLMMKFECAAPKVS